MKTALKPLFQVAKVLVALGLLYYLFASGRIDVQSLKHLLEPTMVVAGLSCVGAALILASERWRLLLTQQGFQVSMYQAFRLTLIGTFFGTFVPGGVGGDLVKAVLIAQNHPQNRAKVVLTVLADRVLGLFTMLTIALFSFGFESDLLANDLSVRLVFVGLLALFCAFLLMFYLLLAARAEGLRNWVHGLVGRFPRLQKLWIFSQSYRLTFREISKLFALSVTAQLISVLLFMIFASRLVTELPPIHVFLFAVPVGFMVTAVPLAPGGIGVGQAAFFYLFSKAMGHENDIGAVGITAYQALMLVYGIVGAGFFVLLKRSDSAVAKIAKTPV